MIKLYLSGEVEYFLTLTSVASEKLYNDINDCFQFQAVLPALQLSLLLPFFFFSSLPPPPPSFLSLFSTLNFSLFREWDRISSYTPL